MLGSLLVLCSVARGQDRVGFQIAVHAPADRGCPSAERLTELVAERAGRPASSASVNYQLSFDVAIEPTTSGHRARVRVSDANGHDIGQRELTVEGACSVLEDMLTLVIASSIGVSSVPLPAAEVPTPRDASTERTTFRVEPEQRPDTSAVPTGAPAPRVTPKTVPWVVDLIASGRALTGLLPKLTGAASLGLFADRDGVGLGLSGTWLPPVTTRALTAFPLHSTGAWGELSVCGRLARMPHSTIAFCGGLQAGALRAYADTLWQAQPRWDGFVQLAPGMRGRFAIVSRLGLVVAVGATFPLVFPSYSYVNAAGAVSAYQAAGLGVWAEFGIWVGLGS